MEQTSFAPETMTTDWIPIWQRNRKKEIHKLKTKTNKNKIMWKHFVLIFMGVLIKQLKAWNVRTHYEYLYVIISFALLINAENRWRQSKKVEEKKNNTETDWGHHQNRFS